MHYILHKKSFSDEIINAHITDKILIYGKSFIHIYDHDKHLIASKHYNTRIIQSSFFNNYIVVLLETCRMEVLKIIEIKHPTTKTSVFYNFELVCLRYYEQANLHTHSINTLTPHDIYDKPCYVLPHASFKIYKNIMLLRISVTHIAFVTHDSIVYDLTGTGLEGFNSFCFMPDFSLPTALFVCDTIKLVTLKTMMKIDEFRVDNVMNAYTLNSGICLQTQDCLYISHSKNYKNFYELKISGYVCVIDDEIYVCGKDVLRVCVFFMYGRVKECLVEKIFENRRYDWISVGNGLCMLGCEDNDCDLFEIKYNSTSLDTNKSKINECLLQQEYLNDALKQKEINVENKFNHSIYHNENNLIGDRTVEGNTDEENGKQHINHSIIETDDKLAKTDEYSKNDLFSLDLNAQKSLSNLSYYAENKLINPGSNEIKKSYNANEWVNNDLLDENEYKDNNINEKIEEERIEKANTDLCKIDTNDIFDDALDNVKINLIEDNIAINNKITEEIEINCALQNENIDFKLMEPENIAEKSINGNNMIDREIEETIQNQNDTKEIIKTEDHIYMNDENKNQQDINPYIDNTFIENLYESTNPMHLKSSIQLIHKHKFINYSIRSMQRFMNQLVGVGKNKLVVISDYVEMNLQFVMKICGFIRFFKVGKMFCLTNQRESYFISLDGKEIDTFILDRETLEFSMIDSKYIQITTNGIHIFDEGTKSILSEIKNIKNVKRSKDTFFIHDLERCLWLVKDMKIVRKYYNVDLFTVDKDLWILSEFRLLRFNHVCTFECEVDFSDVIFNVIKPETLKIEDNEIFINQSKNTLASIISDFVIHQNVAFFLTGGKIVSYRCYPDCLKSLYVPLPPITLSGFIKLKDKLFIRPDVLITFSDGLSVQRVSHRVIHITDRHILTRNTFSKYKFGPPFQFKYEIPDFDCQFIAINNILVLGGFIKDTFYQHSIRLISLDAIKHENIINPISDYTLDKYEYSENEFITDMKFLNLNDSIKSEHVARKYYNTYLVILSSTILGYTDTTRGRIMVFEIIEVQTENLNIKTKKLRLLADHRVSSNVIQCTEIRGHIAVCQGTRLMLYKFDRLDGLTAIAFHDMQLTTMSIATVKNYLLAGDVISGISLFYYQCKPVKIHKLSVSGKVVDLKHVTVLSFHSRTSMSEALFVAFDVDGVYVYTYSPNNVTSKNGEILVQRCQMFLNDSVLGSDNDVIFSSGCLYKIRQSVCSETDVKMIYENGKKRCLEGSLKPITVKEMLMVDDIERMCIKKNIRIEQFCDDVKWN